MSKVGKTLLKGHGLRHEGAVSYLPNGTWWSFYPRPGQTFHAKCECGALSPAGISQSAARRWHREHKDALRGDA